MIYAGTNYDGQEDIFFSAINDFRLITENNWRLLCHYCPPFKKEGNKKEAVQVESYWREFLKIVIKMLKYLHIFK